MSGPAQGGMPPGTVPFAGPPPAYGEPGVPTQPPPQSPRQRLLQQQQQAAGYPPAPGPYGYGQQAVVEEFESLSLTPQMGPGGAADAVADPTQLPRPVGVPDQAPFTAAANSPPTFFRLTCNAIPSSGSLRSRWHLPLGAVLQPLARPNKGVSPAPHRIQERMCLVAPRHRGTSLKDSAHRVLRFFRLALF
jgi:protein transport protein SEC24